MFESLTERRYLIPFKAARLPQQFVDVLVVGGGVAGLRAAIAAADAGADVLVLTKDTIDESNTWYAQGGIAAVLQPLDSVESHIKDTEIGGAGLCDDEAVRIVIEEGPKRVLELLDWGANFDKQAGNPHGLAFTREGGHSYARILHAYGDATGKELAQTLIRTVRSRDNIRVIEKAFVIDLLTENDRCLGVLSLIDGKQQIIWAKRTVLASGGAGTAVPRVDQSTDRDGRRSRHGVPRRCGFKRHGDGAIPSHDAVRRRQQPGADHRSRPRRRRVFGRPRRQAVHDRLSPRRRARAARRRQPCDRDANPQNPFHARVPRPSPSAEAGVPRAIPEAGDPARSV